MESSEGSTTAMTTSPPRVEAEVQGADANMKCDQEESYWQWKERQLDYLKLPIYKPTPKSARCKKILPPINNQENRNLNVLNTSRYVVLPDLESEEES